MTGVFDNDGSGFPSNVDDGAHKEEREEVKAAAAKVRPFFYLLDRILSGTTATGEWAVSDPFVDHTCITARPVYRNQCPTRSA